MVGPSCVTAYHSPSTSTVLHQPPTTLPPPPLPCPPRLSRLSNPLMSPQYCSRSFAIAPRIASIVVWPSFLAPVHDFQHHACHSKHILEDQPSRLGLDATYCLIALAMHWLNEGPIVPVLLDADLPPFHLWLFLFLTKRPRKSTKDVGRRQCCC